MGLRAIHGTVAGVLVAFAFGCGQGGNSKDGNHAGASGTSTANGGSGGTTGGGPSTGGDTSTSGATSAGGTSTGGSSGESTGAGGTGGSADASGGMPSTGAGGAGDGGGAGRGTAGRGRGGMGAGGTGTAGTGTGAGGSPAVGGAGSDVIVTITNGVFWNDTDGNRIEAHGAGLIYTNDAWYWIGEDKSANSGNFKAVNCYRSTDLSHWEFRHAIITKQTSTDLAASDRIIERPKVVYNDSTKKYVMWLHWEGANYATAEAGVFTSDTVDGDYTQVRHFQPNGNMSRDDTLFKDPDDGKAYFLSAANNNQDSALYLLTDDYTNISKQIGTLWKGQQREAPAIMKANGTYFIVNSAATNWDPNQQKYGSATAMDGTWSSLNNVGDGTGYDTQTAFIIPYVGSKTTTYIYAGDRWQDPDLKSSKYIWLPLKVNGTKLVMDNYDSWQLNVTTGEWSAAGAGNSDGFLPQTTWKLVSADSEETQAEDGSATNAFDGSTSTYWHTQYTGAKPAPPHEIVIDLGASYSLTSFRYTPRQDGNQNGMVKDYEFYVSDSTTAWGDPVKTGAFGTSTSATTVTFTATPGRYIRFRGMDEINGKAYTSVAELNVAGTPVQ